MGFNEKGARFIADRYFLEELFEDTNKTVLYLSKLNKIHYHSNICSAPMSHNLILDDCFKHLIDSKRERSMTILGAFHPVTGGDKDLHTAIIKHAIAAADDPPYATTILTTAEQLPIYLANKHYQDESIKTAVKICCDQEAIAEIDRTAEIYDIASSYKAEERLQ